MGLVPGMPNLAFLLMAALCGGGAYALRSAGAAAACGASRRAADPRAGASENARALLGRCAPGGPARPRSRLSPGAAGRQDPERRPAGPHARRAPQAVAGARLPGARGAHPRQPRAARRTLTASISAACRSAKASSIRSASWRINPGRVFGTGAGHRHARSGLRHGGGLDRARGARPRADARLHRGRSEHRHRHPPELHHPDACARAARPRGSPAPAEQCRQDGARSWSRIWCRSVLPLAALVRVLQGLLAERVPIRNMRAIVETLAEQAPRSPGPGGAAGQVRVALGRQIVQDIAGSSAELPVMTLDPDLERLLQGVAHRRRRQRQAWNRVWQRGCNNVWRSQRADRSSPGEPAVLLVPPPCVRHWRASCARAYRDCTCWRGTRFPTTARCVW